MSLARSPSPDAHSARSAADIKSYLVNELSKSLEVEPAAIDTAAPLVALGVDSLMALGMAGSLAAWLDRDVPATLIWDFPTIDAIAVELATGKDAPPLPAGTALLQPDGDATPLFCFPGLAGTPVAFLSVAEKLGPGHKVYGVAVPGYDGSIAPFARVEDIAAAMLQSIRQVQPTGPYMLAGHCFGGFLAFEAARQLTCAGEHVSLLAIYDAFTRGGRRLRPRWQRLLVHAYLLASGKLRLKDALAKVKQMRRVTNFEAPNPDYWIDPVPKGTTPATIIWKVNAAAAAAHTPGGYAGPVVLFQATERSMYNRFYKSERDGGWGSVARGGVRIEKIPGKHGSLIGPEHAESAAHALRPFLDSAIPCPSTDKLPAVG